MTANSNMAQIGIQKCHAVIPISIWAFIFILGSDMMKHSKNIYFVSAIAIYLIIGGLEFWWTWRSWFATPIDQRLALSVLAFVVWPITDGWRWMSLVAIVLIAIFVIRYEDFLDKQR